MRQRNEIIPTSSNKSRHEDVIPDIRVWARLTETSSTETLRIRTDFEEEIGKENYEP